MDGLEQKELNKEEMQSFAAEIKHQLNHTTQILDNLLNWAKSELSLDKKCKGKCKCVFDYSGNSGSKS